MPLSHTLCFKLWLFRYKKSYELFRELFKISYDNQRNVNISGIVQELCEKLKAEFTVSVSYRISLVIARKFLY
jgi:hypothetical protein